VEHVFVEQQILNLTERDFAFARHAVEKELEDEPGWPLTSGCQRTPAIASYHQQIVKRLVKAAVSY
jgi:hypothetical protein